LGEFLSPSTIKSIEEAVLLILDSNGSEPEQNLIKIS
jgi:hypothetical protein